MKKSVVDNAKLLINKAQEDFLFNPEEDQSPRFIQAFFLQSSVIEGLIREFCNACNRKNKINRLKAPRTFGQSAREARVAGHLSESEYKKLSEYIDYRNGVVHSIVEKNDLNKLEKEIDTKYTEGLDIFNFLLDKDI